MTPMAALVSPRALGQAEINPSSEDHHVSKLLEDAHLQVALAEAEAVVAEAEQHHRMSQAAAWWSCVRTLRRFLDTPPSSCYPQLMQDDAPLR